MGKTLRRTIPMLMTCLLTLGLYSVPLFADEVTNKEQHVANYYPSYPTPNYGNQPVLIKRGEYLAKIGDCISCHTDAAAGGKPYAGGLGIETPFGMFYVPNITPDKETGIGNWSDQDFIRAMHHGVGPHGQYYFPVFPYTSFTKVYDQDLLAIKAYLMSIPAVHQENKKPGASWPFSWRDGQYFWQSLFFKPGYYQYDYKKSAQWNRGAYLVEGLGHCGECHTPRNFLGAMETKHHLSGAFIEGYWAPDITAYGLANTHHDDLVEVFTKGELIHEAGPIRGPMAEVHHNSLIYLTPQDTNAMIEYMLSIKSEVIPRVPELKNDKTTLAIGKSVYEETCAICHDTGKTGAPILADTGNWNKRLEKEGLKNFYLHAFEGFNTMPPMGGCVTCTRSDVEDAVDYMLSTLYTFPTRPTPKWTLSTTPDTSINRGKIIYETTCSQCHNTGQLGAPKIGDAQAWTQLVDKYNVDGLVEQVTRGSHMPPKGGCKECTDADMLAAVKYMLQQSIPNSNYSLW